MKKALTLFLCFALIMSLMACGKDPEPTTGATTTAAPTTTEEVWKTDKNAKAEDVFADMMKQLSATIKNSWDKEAADELQYRFAMDADAAIALVMPMMSTEASGADSKMTMTAKGQIEGLVDNKKGTSATVKLEIDAGELAGLLGGMGGSESSAEDQTMKIEMGLYVDMATQRVYMQDPDDGSWKYQELTPEVASQEDLAQIESFTLDKLFESHKFEVTKEEYIFEGTLKIDTESLTNAESQAEMAAYLEMVKDLKPTVKLVADADKRITHVEFSLKDYSMDLGEMMSGMALEIQKVVLNLDLTYEAVNYSLPDDVKNNAVAE